MKPILKPNLVSLKYPESSLYARAKTLSNYEKQVNSKNVKMVLYKKQIQFVFVFILLFLVIKTSIDVSQFNYPMNRIQNFVRPVVANFWKPETDEGVKVKRNFLNYLVNRLEGSPYPGVEHFEEYVKVTKGRKPLLGHKALRPEFGPVINDVTYYDYPIPISPCKKSKDKNSLLSVVISAPGNFEAREVIRQTWVRQLKSQPKDRHSNVPINLVGFAFIVGLTDQKNVQKQIEDENKKYKDILQIGMVDTYYNLTIKTAGVMNWIHKYCLDVDFILKTDDDVYVNVNNLAATIQNTNRSEQVLYGSRANNIVQRGNKYHIDVKDWPWASYSEYPTGNAVLIMGSTVEPLLAASQTIPFLPFEDAYFWGLCREKVGIKNKISSGRFFGGMDKFPAPPCEIFMTVTWVITSMEGLKKSHEDAENLYSNKTKCEMAWPNDSIRTINPSKEVYPSLF